ncbi:MAG: hypothetical protein IMZ69_11095, partial [Spirochaetes bacterium]|nr:hypothetical protein [Spirochaetota bacterium]
MAEGDVVATSPLRKTTVRMQRSSLVLLNAVTSWAGTLIGAAITFFLVPFLIAQLGKEGYGLTGLAITVMAFAGIAQLGLGGAMSRHLAEHIAKGDTHRFNEVVSSGATVFLPMGVVLASACVIFAPELVGLLNVSAALHDQALFVVRYYTAGAVVLSFVTPVFGGVITSTGKFTAHNYIGATCSIGRGILLFAVLGLTDWGLKGWCIVCLLVEVVRLTLLRYAAYRFWPEMRIAPRFVSRGALATLFSLGGNLFVLR